MTRFARAKGSKSSNLKAPDDSTPWEVMKDQLLQAKKENEDNKNRQQAENQRIENYSNFLKEQKVLKRKATWCDFPETDIKKNVKDNSTPKETKLKKKKKQAKSNFDANSAILQNDDNVQQKINNEDSTDKSIKIKKKKKKTKGTPNESEPINEELKDNQVDLEPPMKKKQKNKHKKQKGVDASDITATKTRDTPKESEPINERLQDNQVHLDPTPKKKPKNKKKKQKSVDASDVTTTTVVTDNNQTNKQGSSDQKTKPKKKRGDKPTRRKEINDRSFQLIINGKEVELMRFDGFPIMKKDAERLNELKKSMINKGIPKSEVNRTIKLERRRAEKALARLKRDVCYNCRKGGHNLSDCPELKSNIPGVDAADGVCFKCGSTEHRQFECKVQRDKEFRFANCFICKEQGHIARQCPDNPKGLYPNGGCCKLCGDVTHLRKDCPTVQNKEGTSMKLQMLDTGNNIEDIELQSNPVPIEGPRKPKKIRF